MVDQRMWETSARQTRSEVEQQRSARAQMAGNLARQAFFTVEHRVSGVGYMSMKQPIMFGCEFTHKPTFTRGPELLSFPDSKHYRYPVCDAGVYKWVTEPTPEAKAAKGAAIDKMILAKGSTVSGTSSDVGLDDSAVYSSDELLYKGAYMYFVVQIDSIARPRTNGSNLTQLQAQLAQLDVGSADYIATEANIKEAQEALYLTAHPAKADVIFHLMWMGTALKGVPTSVTDELHSDPAATPNVTPI